MHRPNSYYSRFKAYQLSDQERRQLFLEQISRTVREQKDRESISIHSTATGDIVLTTRAELFFLTNKSENFSLLTAQKQNGAAFPQNPYRFQRNDTQKFDR